MKIMQKLLRGSGPLPGQQVKKADTGQLSQHRLLWVAAAGVSLLANSCHQTCLAWTQSSASPSVSPVLDAPAPLALCVFWACMTLVSLQIFSP